MICEICEKEIDDEYFIPEGKYFWEKRGFDICLNCYYKFNNKEKKLTN